MTIQKSVLENGIRVITDARQGIRSVSIGVLVNAGPRDEHPEHGGLAHLVEHMMFQGTSSRSATTIARLIDAAGDHVGAFTARDYTCFYATVLDDYYPYLLDLFGDILLNSTFPEESLATERESILREINGERDSPSSYAHQMLKSAAWSPHVLGRPITGEPATVKTLTREDIIYFVHEHYLPNRIIITAAGNVNHDDFVAQVRDAFWRLQGHSSPAAQSVVTHCPGIALQHLPVSQAYFSLGFPAYPYADPNRYSLHLLNNILGGGISSRLFRHLREERGLVYHIDSQYHAYLEGGMLVIEGSTFPENLMYVLSSVFLEFWNMISGEKPIDREELWNAKMHIRGQHIIGSEDTNTCMSRLASQELYFGRTIDAEEILSEIEEVNEETLSGTGRDLLENAISRATLAVVGPELPEHYNEESLNELIGA